MKTRKEPNPIGRLSVPSVSDMADEIMRMIGLGTLDMANEQHRSQLRSYLINVIGREIEWKLRDPLEKATAKAISHVLALMQDENYQEVRRIRRAASRERMALQQAESDKRRIAENLERKVKNAGGKLQ